MSFITGQALAQAVVDELGIAKRDDAQILRVDFETEFNSVAFINIRVAVGYGLMSKIDNRIVAGRSK